MTLKEIKKETESLSPKEITDLLIDLVFLLREKTMRETIININTN